MTLVRGTIVHTPSLGNLEILDDHILGQYCEQISFLMIQFTLFFKELSDHGTITRIVPGDDPEAIQMLQNNTQEIIIIPQGSFILPAFCDIHLHAPQFLYQGTGLDLPLMQWLDTYALKAEARMDADPALARRVYTRLAHRLKENGTGAALLFGTIKEETNLILAECMQSAGCRAFVGKLSMDIDITPPDSVTTTYVEPSVAASLGAAESFIKHCHEIVSKLPEAERLVEPVLTPRFVPTCTDALLKGLSDISRSRCIKIQSHMAEAKDQVEWVRAERGMEDIDVFDKNNLLTPRTVQAHCTFLDIPEFERVAESGTAIAHCPLSNAYFSAKPFPLREALDVGVKVGLGTDVAGGYSLDIMNSMRQAVAVSRMRHGSQLMNADHCKDDRSKNLAIDWKESLYLATRGGSLALGLQGMFLVGAPFDAQEIRIYDPQTGVGIGPLDYFDLEGSVRQNSRLAVDEIEKWWSLGDIRNRGSVWIQGMKVRGIGQYSVT